MCRSLSVGLIQLLFITCLVVTGLAIAPDAQETDNPYTTRVDVRMGQRLFRAQCGRCHGRDARGNDETAAPDLTTGRFQHASNDAGIFRVIRNGIDGTAMIGINPNTADETVWQIVAYLSSLHVDPNNVDLPGNATAGQQVFNEKGNCASCHMVNGQGGRLGPDLSTVGDRRAVAEFDDGQISYADKRSPSEMRTDLMDPNKEVEPRWWTMKVTRADGSVVEGLRMNEDTFTIRIIDKDENLWSFSKSEVRSYERIETSTMPSYEQMLTASEVDDLVAYLFSLRRKS